MKVTNAEELLIRLEELREAQREFATFTQEQVDKIFLKAAMAANNARIPISNMAVEETSMGIVEDKVIKNHYASEHVYNAYRSEKTCGVIEEDPSFGFVKVAEPVGIIAAVVPTTNPTSTAIYKALISLKTRNGIIFSPHPKAKKCTVAAVKIILDAAVKAGAPEGIIAWIDEPSIELSQMIMKEADMILATGGPSMVKAAYSSGKPAVGVGPGNAPVLIDETADLKMAINSILLSKTFDNGMICASEQSIQVVDQIYDEAKKELIERGAYILNKDETDKVRSIILKNSGLNAEIVGQSAFRIAEMAGIKVPKTAKVLVGEVESGDIEEPFSHEKLSPVLAMYRVDNFEKGIEMAEKLVKHGGLGHTSVLYTDEIKSKDRIEEFSSRMKTGRVIINMPSSQGAIGDLFNFKLPPSLTLGCGSWGGNSVSENVGVKHLLNIKSVARRRDNMLWFKVPEKVYFKYGCLPIALKELKVMGKKKAFIVTDKVLYDLGYTKSITKVLDESGIAYSIFTDVEPDPTIQIAKKGAEEMRNFEPDVIIGLGGGSSMDAAKIMHVLYEHPEVEFEDLAMRFADIRKRVYTFPKMGEKAMMISVATSAGTGSEVTPFTIITDEETHTKYALADYELTPDMAIIDAELMMNMPKGLTASSGIDALTHALEAYVSTHATEYTNGLSLEAIELIFKYLPIAYNEGTTNMEARERMGNAAALAGMAFANAYLGICHSLAHKLGAFHNVPHGIANAILINEVIRFNGVDDPRKQAAFSQYKYPNAKERYAEISDHLRLGGKTEDQKMELLIEAIEELKVKVGIPKSVSDFGINKEKFFASLDSMSDQAFDDQCTGSNPRYPSVAELKEIYIKVF